ncbi:putative calcium-transporting ATPase 11, plasma membrane-type-like [Hibiscus syriacus]|uniref:Calcium-transporting ATPase 11, plasma membrane-type-like n=1 Tax=Hibiscus syriacus TaxID=106335 RepID=A0A6A2ZCD8_HIBSY|nr:zinc finger CCCH domain-containing protein 46-like isoform X2 [Hibiscus syriacus]KAE8689644.1 putative calcium-transporting ATPase 11, plasma membrane-type-like [Hibiscus syriacus]
MDNYEATRIVFSRIQALEPENASKIMGLLLIQDHGEKEMIRLAFGPEASLQSVILKAKKEFGLPSNSPSSPSTPASPSPFKIPRQNSSASRLIPSSLTIPTNLSTSGTSAWSPLSELPNPDDLISSSSGSLNPSSLPFYGNGRATDMVDEFQLQDQLSFLNESSPQLNPQNHDFFYPQAADLSSGSVAGARGTTDAMGFPSYWETSLHMSSSVSDILGADDPVSGFGWRPCLYFARGYCKNGDNCRFIHGGLGESGADCAAMVGSPNKIEMDQCHELLRSKSAQQQRLPAASRLMGSASFPPYSPKCMNSFLQQQQNDSHRAAAAAAAAAALMMGDDMNKFNRAGMVNPASRQIYLTFPADSTFREEDVSNYFSIYGPVQDVRIPYQQKRMFGFVTFVYPETVKLILAKGNPHFVCDARVLVKPYKEKGKVPDKKQQQMERGEFSPCGTTTGLDSSPRDLFDLQLGPRMFYNNQDLLWRRKLEEQADLQQALDLQNRRLMGLQLLGVKKNHHHTALSNGSPFPSPTHSPNMFNQSLIIPQFHNGQKAPQEHCSSPVPALSVNASEKQAECNATAVGKESASFEVNGTSKESPHREDGKQPESLEHNLPDNPFASPTKAAGEYSSALSNTETDRDVSVPASSINNNWVRPTLIPANNALDMPSFNSFNCQMPRFSSGHGTIGMCAGTGGPTCPVGI